MSGTGHGVVVRLTYMLAEGLWTAAIDFALHPDAATTNRLSNSAVKSLV